MLYFTTEHHAKTFIRNGIVAWLCEGREHVVQAFDVSNTMEITMRVLDQSKALPDAFWTKCKEILSSKKKSAKDYYFQILGYNSLFSERVEIPNDTFKKACLLKIKEAHKSFQKRRVQIWKICRDGDKPLSPLFVEENVFQVSIIIIKSLAQTIFSKTR